ncbi:hypothetical protein ACLKA6_010471 [Drosophila palustris]
MEAIFGGDLAVSGCRTLATLVTEEENILPMFHNENFETELHANCNNEDFSNENIHDENAFNVKSTSSGRRKWMANKERDSYYQKKKIIEADASRTKELRELRIAMEENNAIQLARNNLLEKLVEKLSAQSSQPN